MPNPRYNITQVVSTMLMIWVGSSIVLLFVTLAYDHISKKVFGDTPSRDFEQVQCGDYAPTHGEVCY